MTPFKRTISLLVTSLILPAHIFASPAPNSAGGAINAAKADVVLADKKMSKEGFSFYDASGNPISLVGQLMSGTSDLRVLIPANKNTHLNLVTGLAIHKVSANENEINLLVDFTNETFKKILSTSVITYDTKQSVAENQAHTEIILNKMFGDLSVSTAGSSRIIKSLFDLVLPSAHAELSLGVMRIVSGVLFLVAGSIFTVNARNYAKTAVNNRNSIGAAVCFFLGGALEIISGISSFSDK